MTIQTRLLVAALTLILLVGGGFLLLTMMDIPAPSEEVVKTLDDDRFPS